MVESMFSYTISKVTRLLLTSLAPLQYFLDSPSLTHVSCLADALEMLRQDGKNHVAVFFEPFENSLSKGLLWADRSWKNAGHYYRDPQKQGLILWPGALAEFQYYYNKFLTYVRKDTAKGMFYLGTALHLVQDMAVPHHAAGAIFNGHQEFEKWAGEHYRRFAVTSGGIYLQPVHPGQWLEHNANISLSYYPAISLKTEQAFLAAAKDLLPLTIKTTAGFLNYVYGELE